MSDDRKRFTGLDALSEIGRRLEDALKVVQTKINKGGDEPHTFTIETARGPITGVFGFEVRDLTQETGKRPAARAQRPTPAAAAPHETGPLVDIFDEGQTIVVILDLPSVDARKASVQVAGDQLTLADPESGTAIAAVTLPRAVAAPEIEMQSTNGIVEIRVHGN